MQPPVGPVTPLTYISRDAQRHLANLNAGPLALRVGLYHILYVDDITILGASLEVVKELKAKLAQHYEISDIGKIQSYLGIRISRDQQNKHLTIDQSGYVKDVLECFGMADANPHHTPLLAGADMHLVKYNLQASASDIKLL